MSKFNKFEFSVQASTKTLVKVSVRQDTALGCVELNNCKGFSFTVEIDDKTTDNKGISITTEEAKRLAFKKAIEVIQDFALSQGISLE
jgi:hypothetical protein